MEFNLPVGAQIHQRFMLQALHEAELAYMKDEVPVGAVIVKDGVIVGRGHNLVETMKDPTAHAEIIAITSACNTLQEKYLTDCTLYVTLEPCVMCSGALVWSKISRIVFGAMDEKSGGCGSVYSITNSRTLNHNIEIIQGILEYDCSDILKRFFARKRQT